MVDRFNDERLRRKEQALCAAYLSLKNRELQFGLHTKFIKAEREHKCGKIQVSPALPDTIEGAEALVFVMDVGIKDLL